MKKKEGDRKKLEMIYKKNLCPRDELNQQVLWEFLATFQFQGLDFDLALRYN
jgi:Sec7-like guanine-nucleotide exchange factor